MTVLTVSRRATVFALRFQSKFGYLRGKRYVDESPRGGRRTLWSAGGEGNSDGFGEDPRGVSARPGWAGRGAAAMPRDGARAESAVCSPQAGSPAPVLSKHT